MSTISVSNLTFAYDGSYDDIFDGVSFQIDTDWHTGLIGRNGRGKTTFFRLLRGMYSYSGSIHCDVELDSFPYTIEDPSLMALDVLQTICPQAEEWEFYRELSYLEVDTECLFRPYSSLSQGEQTKLQLAALFLKENTYLLIDEPTNHLDRMGREILGSYLSKKSGFLLISHDRTFLDSCVDHIVSINRTDIEVVKGNFSTWWENRQRREQFEQGEFEKNRKERKRLETAARQSAAWSSKVESSKNGKQSSGLKADKGFVGHKAAKMMQRAKNQEKRMETAIRRTEGLLQNTERAEELKLHPVDYRASKLLSASHLSYGYTETPLTEDLTFEICVGDRIAVSGKNGSGKSSLLHLLRQTDNAPSVLDGTLDIGSGISVSYVAQNSSALSGSFADYTDAYGIDASIFFSILRKMGMERVQFEKQLEDLSEGQKKKVMLARSLCESANLYIWDEPLNYLDIYSRMQIEDLLTAFSPTMIFIEHDRYFEDRVATKTISL